MDLALGGLSDRDSSRRPTNRIALNSENERLSFSRFVTTIGKLADEDHALSVCASNPFLVVEPTL